MKIRNIVEMIDREKVNAFSGETKLRWISELDGKLAIDVMLMDISEIGQFRYGYPEDLDREPLVSFPHDDLYRYWLCAMIDAQNGEYNRYQNSMVLYNAALDNFKEWYTSNYAICGCADKVTAYITAYALAVKQGFVGDVDEWLASLVGPRGPQGIPGAKIRIGRVETLPAGSQAYAMIEGTAEDPVLNIGIPIAGDGVLSTDGGTMTGVLNMGKNRIEQVAEPVENADAATKNYVDSQALAKAGGTMTGVLNMGKNRMEQVAEPVQDGDAANKAYVDSRALAKAGGTMTGNINMGGKQILGMTDPTQDDGAATKGYVDRNALLRSGGNMKGALNMNNQKLTGLTDPEGNTDAVPFKVFRDGGMCYRGTTQDKDVSAAAVEQGLYKIVEDAPVCSITDGVVLHVGGEGTALQLIVSGDGSKVCLRTYGEDEWNAPSFLSFGFGAQLPENGLEGELFFVEE